MRTSTIVLCAGLAIASLAQGAPTAHAAQRTLTTPLIGTSLPKARITPSQPSGGLGLSARHQSRAFPKLLPSNLSDAGGGGGGSKPKPKPREDCMSCAD